MKRAFRYNRGQALVELAVFGSLVIMLLVWMLGLGQNMNASQTVTMHSFRMAQKLARERSKQGGSGTVAFTTIASTYPVNPVNRKTSLGEVSGSGSVMWENEMFALQPATSVEEVDPVDYPASFYQIGKTMIKNGLAIKWPVMLVKRKPNTDKPTHIGDWFVDFLQDFVNAVSDVSGDEEEETNAYYSVEDQGVKDSIKDTEEVYSSSATLTQTGSNIHFSEDYNKNKVISTTTYELLDNNKLKDWDEYILEIDNDYKDCKGGKFIIRQEQTLEGTKSWDSSLQ